MKKNRSAALKGALLAALTVLAVQVYRQRRIERTPSLEAIDDPSVERFFSFVSKLPHMVLMRKWVAERAVRLMPRGAAADLGCGPGLLVVEMAKRAPELKLTGVDLAEDLLEEGRRYAAIEDVYERVDFKNGNVQELPFEDESLDLVVSTLSLHHWVDPVAVFNEIERVLRPGGAFLVFDLRRDMFAPVYLLLWFATRVIVPRNLKFLNEPLGSRDSAYTPFELADLLSNTKLNGWRVENGSFWLTAEGYKDKDR